MKDEKEGISNSKGSDCHEIDHQTQTKSQVFLTEKSRTDENPKAKEEKTRL